MLLFLLFRKEAECSRKCAVKIVKFVYFVLKSHPFPVFRAKKLSVKNLWHL